MRTFASLLAGTALVLSTPAFAADPPVAPLRHVVLEVGEMLQTPAGGVRTYRFLDGDGAASLQVGADGFQIRAAHKGQALLLMNNGQFTQTLVVDVVSPAFASAPEPKPVTSGKAGRPAAEPKSTSVSRADTARQKVLNHDYRGAHALLSPAVGQGNATVEELTMLRAVCRQLRDQPCVELTHNLLEGNNQRRASETGF